MVIYVPQSKQIAEKIWQTYKFYKAESHVVRSGFGLYGIYAYDRLVPFVINKPESDLEHSAGVAMLIHLLAIFCPELIPPAELASFMLAAEAHEIGEVLIGDIPDDGQRDEALKIKQEKAAVAKFAEALPEVVRADLLKFFDEFDDKSSKRGRILYCADKIEAVLQGLLYESKGLVGDIRCKEHIVKLSEQDQRGVAKSGSFRLADIWAVHFVEKVRKYPEAEIFLEILDVAVHDVRGEGFAWMEQFKT